MSLFEALAASGILVAYLGMLLVFDIRDRRLRRRMNELRARGPFVHTASNNGVIAVVRADDYARAVREFEDAVKKGERKPWEKIQYRIRPTFIYWTQETSRNFVQVGGRKELFDLLKALVMKEGGFSESEWSRLSGRFGNLESYVAETSPFLFVPFTSGGSMEEQMKMFPRYRPEQAQRYLVYGEDCHPMDQPAA